MLLSIWGSDTNDVYAIGHNAVGGNASLYHFDGTQWSVIKITKAEGGFIDSYVSFREIDGSGKNDVWAVGRRGGYYGSSIDSSLVIHFDGSSWKEIQIDRGKHSLQGLKVLGLNDVYMSGTYGEIYHFDGTQFTKIVVDTNLAIKLGGDKQRMFAGGISTLLYPNQYISVFSKVGNGTWTRITTATEIEYGQKRNFGFRDFYPAGSDKYFACGEGIFSIQDTFWHSSSSDKSHPYIRLSGTSPTNVFALCQTRKILHWNGVDWRESNLPENISTNSTLWGLWVKGNNIFISCYYKEDTNIIYRGTY
ncbi:MAG: hypothetical protein WCW35_09010 [Bacteroidota bacterium]